VAESGIPSPSLSCREDECGGGAGRYAHAYIVTPTSSSPLPSTFLFSLRVSTSPPTAESALRRSTTKDLVSCIVTGGPAEPGGVRKRTCFACCTRDWLYSFVCACARYCRCGYEAVMGARKLLFRAGLRLDIGTGISTMGRPAWSSSGS